MGKYVKSPRKDSVKLNITTKRYEAGGKNNVLKAMEKRIHVEMTDVKMAQPHCFQE